MKTITIDGIEYTLTPVAQPEKASGNRWRADKRGQYFTINTNGSILDFTENGDKLDNYAYNSGNYYKTEEEAERARDKQLALVRVTDKLREIEADIGWVIDLDDASQNQCTILYNHILKKPEISTVYTCYNNSELLSSSTAISYVIEHMQDDLKLIFGVE